jgi:hypothetical protein
MSAEVLARRSLIADAAYCAGAAVLALVLARPLSGFVGVSLVVLVSLGSATLAWAAFLALLSRIQSWRNAVGFVAAANSGAAIALAVLAVLNAGIWPRLLLLAVALEVAAFAVVEFAALRGVAR